MLIKYTFLAVALGRSINFLKLSAWIYCNGFPSNKQCSTD